MQKLIRLENKSKAVLVWYDPEISEYTMSTGMKAKVLKKVKYSMEEYKQYSGAQVALMEAYDKVQKLINKKYSVVNSDKNNSLTAYNELSDLVDELKKLKSKEQAERDAKRAERKKEITEKRETRIAAKRAKLEELRMKNYARIYKINSKIIDLEAK